MTRNRSALAATVLGGFLLAGSALAAPIIPGIYDLGNHPDGNERPPLYGLRLDELVNATGGHDVFTFDFDNANSEMELAYNDVAHTIHIYGHSWGGRDIGGSYANDAHLGVYYIDFTYNIGVGLAPGDDDVRVVANMQNTGSIITPNNGTFLLQDKSDGNFSFRLGDEDNDLGHRNFPGISGWGWLNHGRTLPASHVDSSDWLFTATYKIPEPSSLLLIGLGVLGAAIRRSR